jgi:hypothetical protein
MSLFTTEGLTAIILLLSYCCLLRRGRRPPLPPLRGPPNGDFRALFRAVREDAFLLLLRASHPARVLRLDTVPAVAAPALARSLLASREHSVGRALVYRLIANVMPASDGILFSADAAWKVRHAAFTSLFSVGVVGQYAGSAWAGACAVLRALHERASRATEPTQGDIAGSALREATLGDDDASRRDLLTLVRWAAMRTLFSWAVGVDLDGSAPSGDTDALPQLVSSSAPLLLTARDTARALEAYSRVCFEEMPSHERACSSRGTCCGAFFAWFRAYAALWQFASQIQRGALSLATAPARADRGPAHLPLLARLSAAGISTPRALASELNHVHGAHKAAAFLSTAAMVEVCGGTRMLRARIVAELERLGVGGRANGAFVRLPTQADFDEGRLPVLLCVWRETLRRHVVSMGVMRRVSQEGATALGSEDVEGVSAGTPLLGAGDDVLILLHALHHDEREWGPDAHNFEPDRWDPKSEYWIRRRAWSAAQTSEGADVVVPPPGAGVWVPAAHASTFTPFLDGIRKCAGQHLALVEFAALMSALILAPNAVDVPPPRLPAEGERPCAVEAVGGGTAYLADAHIVARDGALALIRERALPFSTQTRIDEDLAKSMALEDGVRHRVHLVKSADMFSTIDGRIPWSFGE